MRALRDYADKNDYQIVREFVDEAESGRVMNRPDFKRMIEEAKRSNTPFKAILVWKFSRFTRKREHAVVLKSQLRRQGVRVVSITEQANDDYTIPYGIAGATMVLALLASVAVPRWAPAVVGVAGLGVMIFTFIYVVGVLNLDEIPEEASASFGIGFWLASLAFVLVAGLQLIPRPKRPSG